MDREGQDPIAEREPYTAEELERFVDEQREPRYQSLEDYYGTRNYR